MKAKTVINGFVVEVEGTVEEIRELLKQVVPTVTVQPQKLSEIVDAAIESGKLEEILKKLREDQRQKEYDQSPYWPYPYKFKYRYSFGEYCTCPKNGWFGTVPPPACPIHGEWQYYTITCTNGTDFAANTPNGQVTLTSDRIHTTGYIQPVE